MAKKRPATEAPLPSTLERSPQKARATYEATLASAEKTYSGDEARAHRAAWAAVKHSFEKVGDRWETKNEKGPSDPRSERGGVEASGPSYGGVDALGHTKAELLAKARTAGAEVTTRMTKPQIAGALANANDRLTRKAREKSGE